MNPITRNILSQRINALGNLPAMPSILSVLTEELSVRPSQINIERVVENISYDKSLTAQCLRLANSPLVRHHGDVATVKEAVFTLGLWRIRDLAFSCNLPLMFTNICKSIRREVFWRHSLGTASISQALAQEFAATHQNQVYLCGLLHDIGILIDGVLFPDDFRTVLEEAIREKAPITDMEERILGFTHAESGRILAENWRLPLEVAEVIEYHHHPALQPADNALTVLVSVADGICFLHGLDYGYVVEECQHPSLEELWVSLAAKFPGAATRSREEYTDMVQRLVADAISLADHVFSPLPIA